MPTIRVRSLPALAAALLSACVPARASAPLPAAPGPGEELLAPERIAALPEPERRAWTAYVDTSRAWRERDRALVQAELRALGRERWTPAPEGPALPAGRAPEWFRGEEARRTADAIVSFQTPSGGWSKRVALDRPRAPGESFSAANGWSYVGTFDNGATTEHLRFLAAAHAAGGDPRHRDAFLRGLDYVLRAQFPSGCWPQVYPLQGGYHDAATFNDDAMVRVLRLVRDVARGELAAAPEGARERARAALDRGVECVLRSQVVVRGAPTVWGAQHDPLTLLPVAARAYEHASLSGRESAAVVDFLLELEAPSPPVAHAVEAAAAWFRKTAIHGLEYEPKGGLTPREGAGPIWARFYEIGTDRPIFSNRDGVVRYAWSELEDERRFGYAWYTDEPATTLRRVERWSRRVRPAGR